MQLYEQPQGEEDDKVLYLAENFVRLDSRSKNNLQKASVERANGAWGSWQTL